jgi:hypothetical protein
MSLAGVWRNEYGSTMTLQQETDILLSGIYQSSTGATGEYEVIGLQTSVDPTQGAGQAAALTIDWHSIIGGPPDNSWHWVSGLSGQLSIQNGVEVLVLSHALVAPIGLPGIAAGTYMDKLIYRRVHEAPPLPSARPRRQAVQIPGDPLEGIWVASDGTALSIQDVVPYSGNAFGWVLGMIVSTGPSSLIYGVTDINASSAGLSRRSVSIVGLPNDVRGPAISLSGTLDLLSRSLTLLSLESFSTKPDNTYLQTVVSTKVFTKTSDLNEDHRRWSTAP